MTKATRWAELAPMHAIQAERIYQCEKWGDEGQTHIMPEWIAILSAELGEAAQAANAVYWSGVSAAHLRSELIQVAAVAVAMVEQLDRDAGQATEGVG